MTSLSQVRVDLATQGFAVVPLGLEASLLNDVKQAILEFVQASEHAPETWNRYRKENWAMVPLHHHQAVWNVRQHPALHAVFAEIFQTPQLWVSMDRCGFKPPNPSAKPLPMHWDGDPQTPGHYQGLVCLSDTPPGMGGFHCMPGLFQNLESWLSRSGKPKDPNSSPYPVVEVPGQAGDLIVWDTRLPHAGGVNRSQTLRLAQYVTLYPARSEPERLERVTCFTERRIPPQWQDFPPSVRDYQPGPEVTLSQLGRTLVGFTSSFGPEK